VATTDGDIIVVLSCRFTTDVGVNFQGFLKCCAERAEEFIILQVAERGEEGASIKLFS
jgi:hypothetical protein